MSGAERIRHRVAAGLVPWIAVAFAVSGTWLLGEQGWLTVKAGAATILIDRAFEQRLQDGLDHRPWNWADTHPIARMRVPRLGLQRTILAGATGASLAFGPGHVHGTVEPNAEGNCVIAGHRDSWFSFLRDLRIGDEVDIETADGPKTWVVAEMAVRSMYDTRPLDPSDELRLTLVTCYPFDALISGDRRYVVTLLPEEAPHPRPGGEVASAASSGGEV